MLCDCSSTPRKWGGKYVRWSACQTQGMNAMLCLKPIKTTIKLCLWKFPFNCFNNNIYENGFINTSMYARLIISRATLWLYVCVHVCKKCRTMVYEFHTLLTTVNNYKIVWHASLLVPLGPIRIFTVNENSFGSIQISSPSNS